MIIIMSILRGIWFVIDRLSDLFALPFYWLAKGILWSFNQFMLFLFAQLEANQVLGFFLLGVLFFSVWLLWKMLFLLPVISIVVIFIPLMAFFAKLTGAAIMLILFYMAYLKIKQVIRHKRQRRAANA